MRQYKRLAEADRMKRRTIADALEVLRQSADFCGHDRAEIKVGLLQLPSRELVGLIQILFSPSETCGYIDAKTAASRHRFGGTYDRHWR